MKRVALLIWLGLLSLAPANTNIPLYVNVVMHIEENMYPANGYERARTQLVAFANMLYTNEVMFNFQSDWTFLEATTNFGKNGHADTAGTNVVMWMRNNLGFEVDPHAHETTHNYADIAYLLTKCGIPTAELSHIVGGFITYPPTSSVLDHVRYAVTGWFNPSFVWQPEALWGAATRNHEGDTNFFGSGIWRPLSTNEFNVHSENPAHIPNIGGYGNKDVIWTSLSRLIQQRADGLLCTGKLYTCLIMTGINDINATYITNFAAQLQSFKTNANVQWRGLGEVLNIWRTQYASQPTLLPYLQDNDIDGDNLNDGWEVTNNCDITWSNGSTDFDGDAQSDSDEFVCGTDPTDETQYFAVSATNHVITWNSVAGRMYSVETTTNLLGAWTTNYSIAGIGDPLAFTNTSDESAFVRLSVIRISNF